jgi:hypothetical protein
MSDLEDLHQRDNAPAVYVVHGIGKQRRGETAAQLYGNFDDAMTAIERWQKKHVSTPPRIPRHLPYTREGYWADYDNPQNTMGERWKSYSDDEKDFCRELWGQRVISAGATYRWCLKQIFRLWINPVRLAGVTGWGFIIAWPLYVLLTLFAVPLLTIVYFRKSDIMRDYLNDIRLYIDPRGKIERGIVKNVDESLRRDILNLVGLDSDFRPLSPEEELSVLGKKQHFDRIIWLSHSLGTIISYNVLSDLLHEAVCLEKKGDDQQKQGVNHFRNRVARFVTLGSPLDKIAVLFGARALRPLPVRTRRDFFTNADDITVGYFWEEKDWWINFYHVLDPVSGALNNELICGGKSPANFHTRLSYLPGLAHTSYWNDRATLRFILSRAFGRERLPDRALTRKPTLLLTLLAAGSYLIWAIIMIAGIVIMVVWGWQFLQATYDKATGMLAALQVLLGL